MTAGREEVLARIRAVKIHPGSKFERQPVLGSLRPRAEIVEQFAEFAAEYRANVVRTTIEGVREAIVRTLGPEIASKILVSSDYPLELRPPNLAIEEDIGFNSTTIDSYAAVLTTCALAIAETGTIVLDAGPGQGRRAITLIPDHHVCIVFESQVVESIPLAVEKLGPSVCNGRPLTWISGPSATSDIELSRVEGVHGPRILDIVLVSEV